MARTLLLFITAFFISSQAKDAVWGNACSEGFHEVKKQDDIPSSPIKLKICSERSTEYLHASPQKKVLSHFEFVSLKSFVNLMQHKITEGNFFLKKSAV